MRNLRLSVNWVFLIACLVLATGILLAAAGSHLLSSNNARNIWQTANLMQLVHGIGLLFLVVYREAVFQKDLSAIGGRWYLAVIAMILGLFLFCGHLYLKALQVSFFPGWIAPVGGMSFFIAWVSASTLAFTKRD